MSGKKKYSSSFQKSFTAEYPCIVSSDSGSSFAKCNVCETDISVSHGGKSDVVKHLKTSKHKENARRIETNSKINFSTDGKDKAVVRAECLFTNYLLEHNMALSAADHASGLFKKMFPDSQIAKKYSCARTKTSQIVKVMGAEVKSSLVSVIKSAPFCIATDGSNKGDTKLYPVVISYFNEDSSMIQHDLLAVPTLEADSTGVNIANLLLQNLEKCNIPFQNCLAFGADNERLMMGDKGGVAGNLKKENPHLEVIGCLCHLINLAAEKGAASLPVNVDEAIIDMYYYLDKSSKRKEKLKQFQRLYDTDVRKILKHVCTRWLSLGVCLARVIDQWIPLLMFFKEEVKLSSTKTSSSVDMYKIPKISKSMVVSPGSCQKKPEDHLKSKRKAEDSIQDKKVQKTSQSKISHSKSIISREERVFMFLSSDLNKAICFFLRSILPVFDTPNICLQSRVPKIHVLHTVIKDLFKDLLSKFVKPTVMISSDSIFNVKYNIHANQKSDEDLVIGSSSSKVVNDLSTSEQKNFYSYVRNYLCKVCDYIILKFPIKNDLLLHTRVANVASLLDSQFSDIKFFINKFPVLVNLFSLGDTDSAIDTLQSQFCALQLEDMSEVLKLERPDSQWSFIGKMKNAEGTFKYKELSKVMLAVLTIPHSNAECERIFSIVTKTKTQFRPNIGSEMLESILLAKTNIRGNCFNREFSDEFLKKAKSAASNYIC